MNGLFIITQSNSKFTMKRVKYLISIALLAVTFFASAQNVAVKGKVTDAQNGDPVPFASIVVKGTTQGVVADLDGNYSISAPSNAVLVFSSVGYQTQEVQLNGRSSVNVSLSTDAEFLDDVLVVAYGTAKKSSYAGSAALVRSEELVKTPAASVEQALQGKVAGLQITSTSGQPGASTSFRIRGSGSLNASNEPLYVIDGVATTSGSYSVIAESQYSTASIISSINPQDIESITVLKDAAAASLYGSRAANGVVIITTKSGKAGQGKVNFNAQVGVASAPKQYSMMNTNDYYGLVYNSYLESAKASGKSGNSASEWANGQTQGLLTINPFNVAQPFDADGKLVSGANALINTNWQDEVMSTGISQDYSLSYSGGSDSMNYFISGGYFDQSGTTPASHFTRYSAKSSIDAKVKPWISAGANIVFSYSKQKTEMSSSAGASPLFNALQFPNAIPVYLTDAKGNYVLDANGEKQFNWLNPAQKDFNPLATPFMDPNSSDTFRLFASLYTELKLAEGLTAKTVFSPDYVGLYESSYWNKYHGNGPAYNGRGQKYQTHDLMYTSTTTLNFNRQFGAHGVTAMAGYEFWHSDYRFLQATATNFAFDFMTELAGASNMQSISSYTTESTLMSYIAHAEYNYNEKYFLSGSFRRDGSSVFGTDNKWGNFYSVGASWRASEEDFIKDIDWISNLKLRASYGTSGNNAGLGRYQSLGIWMADVSYQYGNNSGMGHAQFSNPDLGWEKQKMLNAGVDFGFLNNRISGSFEVFNKVSDDLLYKYPLPASHGVGEYYDFTTSLMMNMAKVKNNGFEFEIAADIIANKEFSWNASFNFSHNADTILDLAGDDDLTMSDTKKIWKVGHSQYEFYMPTWAGVDSNNGDPLWKKGSGTTNDYASADYELQGKATPFAFGSLTNNFSWKGLNLSVMFYYNLGGKFYDTLYAGMMHDGNDSGKNLHVDAVNAWTAPGQVTNVPKYTNSNANLSNSPSTRFLYDATYLKFKSLNLSYTLPKSLLNFANGNVSSVRIFANADNIATWFKDKDYKGYDDIDIFGVGGYDAYPYYIPLSKTYTFGVNITF